MNKILSRGKPLCFFGRIFLLWMIIFFSAGTAFCQNEIAVNIKSLDKIRGDKIYLDPQGNLYVIQDALLHKYNGRGDFLYSYSNFSLGNITTADVTNPMKIMLYYQETNTILFLDERLAPITDKIDLFTKRYTTISMAAYTTDNQIWLYDYAGMDLVILDLYLNPVARVHYNFPDFHPTQMFEIPGKNVIMHNPGKGVYFFDSFGTYIKTVGIQSKNDIQIIDNIIYYLKDGQLHRYNFKELSEEIIPLKIKDPMQCLRYKGRLFILDINGKVYIYG